MATRNTSQQPRTTKEPLDLLDQEKVLVKYFFSEEDKIPPGIPERKKSNQRPKNRSKHIDDGQKNFETSEVGARLLHTGLMKAEGGQWKLTRIHWWKQNLRRAPWKFQYVVELAYENQPEAEKVVELTPEVRTALIRLAKRFSWSLRVWTNKEGRPATINFTSPKRTPPCHQVVVRNDYVKILKFR